MNPEWTETVRLATIAEVDVEKRDRAAINPGLIRERCDCPQRTADSDDNRCIGERNR